MTVSFNDIKKSMWNAIVNQGADAEGLFRLAMHNAKVQGQYGMYCPKYKDLCKHILDARAFRNLKAKTVEL